MGVWFYGEYEAWLGTTWTKVSSDSLYYNVGKLTMLDHDPIIWGENLVSHVNGSNGEQRSAKCGVLPIISLLPNSYSVMDRTKSEMDGLIVISN